MKKSINVGNVIKEARIAAGLSQGDLAYKLGYSTPQFVSNLERGVSLPPIKSMKKIARIIQGKEEPLAFKILKATIECHQQNIETISFEAFKRSK